MTAAAQLTERDGGRGLSGWRVGGSGPLKRKDGVFNIFDMQATSCGAQQLWRREFKLVRIRNVPQSCSGSERGKEKTRKEKWAVVGSHRS